MEDKEENNPIIDSEKNEDNSFKLKTLSRVQVNDNKAGMQNLDKEKINSIILKHSQSDFFLLFLLIQTKKNIK